MSSEMKKKKVWLNEVNVSKDLQYKVIGFQPY